ncbi:MAG: serine protease, partial [Candidatus Binatia bacterium]
LESARLSQAELEQRIEEERVKMDTALTAHQVETNQMVAMLEEQNRQSRRVSPEEVQLIQSRLKALEVERRSAQMLIRRYGSSICFLYGAYGFLQKGQSAGVPHSLFEYTGTGFLIDKKGLIVTNRHLVEPWTMDPSGVEIVKDGFQPQLVTLLAYFPGRSQPSEVLLVQVSKEGDVALGRVVPIPQGITPIPLGTPAAKGVVGEAVVVLGYPVGVEGVLARMKEQIVDTLLKKPNRNMRRLVHDIAEQRGIRPLATQGHIGDIVPGRLVYDAQTMGGSSGSPVFNLAGEVIAVNSAYLEPFRGGASFGVPITQVLSLIPERS